MTKQEAIRLRSIIEQAAQNLDDQTSLAAKCLHPSWSAGNSYSAGYKVQYSGRLWKVIQAHTSQEGWEPENAPALFTEITESHAGTMEDPIPYNNNMELTIGLYYSQDGVTYRCTRSTGQPVYNALADLVGIYVESV